jgi:endonuclease-8
MPEGHTIHRAARDHARDLAGQRVRITSPQGRFDTEALVDVDGCAHLEGVEAYGKHLFYRFEGERIVHVHLGLFGRFFRRRTPAPSPRSSTRLRLEGATMTIDLVGPTACEVLTCEEMHALTGRLGPDPLRDDASPRRFYAYVARSRAPIGAILMDQSRICGVGNVYRAEVLHLLRLHPDTPGASIPKATVHAMWRLIVGLLRRGVEEKRIVTTRGLVLAKPRERVPRADSTHVYRRRWCRTCEGPVSTDTLRARVVHWCEVCQPLEPVDA